MESEGLLDIDKDLHMFVLRYVFEARINSHLQEFTEGWNHHPLSTKENMSPIQLWLWGLNYRYVESNVLFLIYTVCWHRTNLK